MIRLAQTVSNLRGVNSEEAGQGSGGIWVGWKDNIRINIMHNHPQFMLLLVQGNIVFNSFLYFCCVW